MERNFEFEIWRDVVGYEGFYEVSNYGRVRSRKRRGSHGGILKSYGLNGYRFVHLTKLSITKHKLVHQLVAIAFIGCKPSDNHVVNHINGVKSDNYVDNLEWVTYSENCKHAFREHLVSHKGQDNPKTKLTDTQVILIRNEFKASASGKRRDSDLRSKIAAKYHITINALNKILSRNTWPHLI